MTQETDFYPIDTVYECPICHSRDVRIDAAIYLVHKPNDPDDTLDNLNPMASEVTWDNDSYAACVRCGWEATAGQLVTLETTSSTPQKEE